MPADRTCEERKATPGRSRARARRPGWKPVLALIPLLALPGVLPAQAVPVDRAAAGSARAAIDANLPDAPQAAAPSEPAPRRGTMSATVLDSNGDLVAGAAVTLENTATGESRTAATDERGYFSFAGVDAGTYRLAIHAAGFANWAETSIPMPPGADLDLPAITLKIASATTEVLVIFSQHDLAAEQVRIEEKQRVLGVIPNFYTSYVWNAAPLTAKQKFKLALRSSIDPEAFLASAGIAGVEQAQNDFRGYGQGAQGFAKRFSASWGDGWIGSMIGGAALPVLFHQDPRYFYKGTGTIRQRALYAIATTVICKGDNGRWQPNYANIGGNLAAGALSNLYYPADERSGVTTTIDNALIGTAGGAIGALFQEFLLKKITPGASGHGKP